jgi:hypothetical protein
VTGPEEEIIQIPQSFGDVARALAADDDLQTTLNKIVHLVVDNLDACESPDSPWYKVAKIISPASSNDVPRTVDAIQSEVGIGFLF